MSSLVRFGLLAVLGAFTLASSPADAQLLKLRPSAEVTAQAFSPSYSVKPKAKALTPCMLQNPTIVVGSGSGKMLYNQCTGVYSPFVN